MSASIILAATGRPFSDQDAAREKARIVSEETGEAYSAVIINDQSEYGVVREKDRIRKTPPDQSQDSDPSVQYHPEEETQADDRFTFFPENAEESESDNLSDAILTEADKGTDFPLDGRDTPSEIMNDGGEKEEKKLNPSWKSRLFEYVAAVVGVMMALFPAPIIALIIPQMQSVFSEQAFTISVLVVSGVGWFMVLFMLSKAAVFLITNRYEITENAIISRYGIIFRETKTVSIADVNQIQLSQGLLDRILNVGNLEIATAATAGIEIVFEGISNPLKLQQEILAKIKKHNQKS